MTWSDRINMGLLVAAVVGIGLTYWQTRLAAQTQRAAFLKDLYLTLTSDSGTCEAFYLVDYGRFQFDEAFHRSDLEIKVDRLLGFADLVCQLYFSGVLTASEMAFFRYRFKCIADDVDMRKYLAFLNGLYEQRRIEKRPFHRFQEYAAQELGLVLPSDVSAANTT